MKRECRLVLKRQMASPFPVLIFSKLYRRYFPLPWGSLGAYVRVESLQPAGNWREVTFRRETPSRIVLGEEFRATRPYVLRFSY